LFFVDFKIQRFKISTSFSLVVSGASCTGGLAYAGLPIKPLTRFLEGETLSSRYQIAGFTPCMRQTPLRTAELEADLPATPVTLRAGAALTVRPCGEK